MFEFVKLIGSPHKELHLDTRKGSPIRNEVALPPTDLTRRREQLLIRNFGTNWEHRCRPCGVYNCAGLTWASRRTSIPEDAEWIKILGEDGYRKLSNAENPLVGDLAIYHSEGVGFLHVGQVVQIERGLTAQSPPIHKILSKWDSSSGEYIHLPHEVPFKESFSDYRLEYWTDREA